MENENQVDNELEIVSESFVNELEVVSESFVNEFEVVSESSVNDALTVGAKFQSFIELKNALNSFQKANFCQFYVRDSRTLQQAKKFSPKLIQTVPEELKYTFVNYSCIHGGRYFKSRPKTGSRPQQMLAFFMVYLTVL